MLASESDACYLVTWNCTCAAGLRDNSRPSCTTSTPTSAAVLYTTRTSKHGQGTINVGTGRIGHGRQSAELIAMHVHPRRTVGYTPEWFVVTSKDQTVRRNIRSWEVAL